MGWGALPLFFLAFPFLFFSGGHHAVVFFIMWFDTISLYILNLKAAGFLFNKGVLIFLRCICFKWCISWDFFPNILVLSLKLTCQLAPPQVPTSLLWINRNHDFIPLELNITLLFSYPAGPVIPECLSQAYHCSTATICHFLSTSIEFPIKLCLTGENALLPNCHAVHTP